jgi:hypothetical protein
MLCEAVTDGRDSGDHLADAVHRWWRCVGDKANTEYA